MTTLPFRTARQQPPYTWVRRPVPFEGFHDGVWFVGTVGFPLVRGKAYRVIEQEWDHPNVRRLYVWQASGGKDGAEARQYRVVVGRDGTVVCDCRSYELLGGCRHCEATRALFGEEAGR